MDIKALLGKRIKEIRCANKLTQEAVAEIIEMETASLSNIERGKYYPTAENLEKILVALKTTPHELFNFEHHQDNKTLQDEIVRILEQNPDKIKDIYKIVKALTS